MIPDGLGDVVVLTPSIAPGPLDTFDWYGRFRCVANANNDYLVDRKMQQITSYTGIGSIFLQDQAVTESMGRIYDRTNERLGTSDLMIIRTRKRLIDAAKELRGAWTQHPGLTRAVPGGLPAV